MIMEPCCLSVRTKSLPTEALGGPVTHEWRAMALYGQSELGFGEIIADSGDSLVILRDKAMAAARARGFEPQRCILERPA